MTHSNAHWHYRVAEALNDNVRGTELQAEIRALDASGIRGDGSEIDLLEIAHLVGGWLLDIERIDQPFEEIGVQEQQIARGGLRFTVRAHKRMSWSEPVVRNPRPAVANYT
jgi:hypothetical protein